MTFSCSTSTTAGRITGFCRRVRRSALRSLRAIWATAIVPCKTRSCISLRRVDLVCVLERSCPQSRLRDRFECSTGSSFQSRAFLNLATVPIKVSDDAAAWRRGCGHEQLTVGGGAGGCEAASGGNGEQGMMGSSPSLPVCRRWRMYSAIRRWADYAARAQAYEMFMQELLDA